MSNEKFNNDLLIEQTAHSLLGELFSFIKPGFTEDGKPNIVPRPSYRIKNMTINFIDQKCKSY